VGGEATKITHNINSVGFLFPQPGSVTSVRRAQLRRAFFWEKKKELPEKARNVPYNVWLLSLNRGRQAKAQGPCLGRCRPLCTATSYEHFMTENLHMHLKSFEVTCWRHALCDCTWEHVKAVAFSERCSDNVRRTLCGQAIKTLSCIVYDELC
jgi:hypothetical protein